jgi:hypothetical protein
LRGETGAYLVPQRNVSDDLIKPLELSPREAQE